MCCVRAMHRTRAGGPRSIHGPGGEEGVFHRVALLDQGLAGAAPEPPAPALAAGTEDIPGNAVLSIQGWHLLCPWQLLCCMGVSEPLSPCPHCPHPSSRIWGSWPVLPQGMCLLAEAGICLGLGKLLPDPSCADGKAAAACLSAVKAEPGLSEPFLLISLGRCLDLQQTQMLPSSSPVSTRGYWDHFQLSPEDLSALVCHADLISQG